jgi:heme-degrading monooxygenase HmoA
MIVRLTYFSLLPGKVEGMKRMYTEETTPQVKQQKGNLDCRLLEPVNEADDYISMTVWENQEDADTYHSSGKYKQLVDMARPNFAKEPVLKIYHAENVMEHA